MVRQLKWFLGKMESPKDLKNLGGNLSKSDSVKEFELLHPFSKASEKPCFALY